MTLDKIQADFRKTLAKVDKLLGQNRKAIEESNEAIQFHQSRREELELENNRANRFKQKLEDLLD